MLFLMDKQNSLMMKKQRIKIMEEKKIILSVEQMKQIARYEITFKDILGENGYEDGQIICPEVYKFTLSDLYQALKRLKDADPTIREFGDYWIYPINMMDEAFGFDQEEELPEEYKGYLGLRLSDSEYFDDMWWTLEEAWEDFDGEEHLSEALDMDELISDFDFYMSNRGKPVEERTFLQYEMENYIRRFNNDEFVKQASEKQLELARKFINSLCDKDNGLALYTKGYACYGGNRLYHCDWYTSRDCMLRLFEKKDEPQYANTLGYIYYYGRCNDGVPEYEKAFHYFGIAAANGMYEGMYKLADMFYHGYGCRESKRTARNLYGMVYDDCLKRFLEGDSTNFADAALRMGNVFAKGINEDINYISAYSYYLQADYAAKIRAAESDFFGNATVVMNTQKALEETIGKLPEGFLREHMDYDTPYMFSWLAEKNYRCEISVITNAGGHRELVARRIPTRSVPDCEDILITIPELSFCARTDEISFTIDDSAEVWLAVDDITATYNYCCWNHTEKRYEFYYDEMLIAWSKSKYYRFYGLPTEPAFGDEYNLVTVRFSASGRTYDYICDYNDIKPGDTVIVEGYNGETEVTVISTAVKKESELGLPVERYKKILRKNNKI